jgi:hypothetical protein
MADARREARRYRRRGVHVGDADLRERRGPHDLVVVWMPLQKVKDAIAAKPYERFSVRTDDPWPDFERQVGLTGLDFDEVEPESL